MSGVPENLKRALSGSYDLERIIGRGGMATVYLARDLKHNRRVAVKVLRPDLAAAIGTDRFLKEIEIAANLTHPHIVPLYDSGQSDGFLYYVMPFIDGESLRAMLIRRKTLLHGEAIEIVRRVADALNYAHSRALLHRDIKPENILLSQGHPVVTDFGIAKAITTAADGQNLTRTGLPIGTPGYMSPEQAAGLKDLNLRTDVFSLACVLYEMVVGDVPGMWLTENAVKVRRFLDASPPHREKLDVLPGRIEQALVHALAPHPDWRTSSPPEFVAELDGAVADRREYGDTEVTDIIRRASEQQLENPTREGGLTVGAIEQAAAEVGIPPDRVRDAMDEVDRPRESSGGSWKWFFGDRFSIEVERYVDGEVIIDEFPGLVEEIRTSLQNIGHASTLGRSLAWTTTNPGQGSGRNVQIMVTPRAGRTRIFLQEGLAHMAGGLFGGIMGGIGGGGGAAVIGAATEAGLALVAAGAGVLMIGGSYIMARAFYTTTARRKRRQLEALADRMAQRVASHVRGRLGSGGV